MTEFITSHRLAKSSIEPLVATTSRPLRVCEHRRQSIAAIGAHQSQGTPRRSFGINRDALWRYDTDPASCEALAHGFLSLTARRQITGAKRLHDCGGIRLASVQFGAVLRKRDGALVATIDVADFPCAFGGHGRTPLLMPPYRAKGPIGSIALLSRNVTGTRGTTAKGVA